MALKTFKELRDHVASRTRETQVSTLIDGFINFSLQEIWNYCDWTFARRKQTFSTVASQEDYALDEEIDRITLLRQLTSPVKLMYVPDHLFYKYLPNPENLSTGTPRFYRKWEETGFSTNLTVADTIFVNSSSTSDTSSFTVRVIGRESTNNLIVAETLTLNGTTAVTSTNTWAIGGLMHVSKSGATTGTITVSGTTGSPVLSRISPEESSPRFKKVSLYPIPSAVITMYIEYIERCRLLVHDTDTPQLDHKWNWVLVEGALSKMWEYKQSEQLATQHLALFTNGMKMMKAQDQTNLDFVPVMEARQISSSDVKRLSDSVNDNFPSYSLT